MAAIQIRQGAQIPKKPIVTFQITYDELFETEPFEYHQDQFESMTTKDPILITNPCDYIGDQEEVQRRIYKDLNIAYVDKLQQQRKQKIKTITDNGKPKKKGKKKINDSGASDWLLTSPGSERRVIWNNPDILSDSD